MSIQYRPILKKTVVLFDNALYEKCWTKMCPDSGGILLKNKQTNEYILSFSAPSEAPPPNSGLIIANTITLTMIPSTPSPSKPLL